MKKRSFSLQDERLKQCPKCEGDSEIQKYVLTDKGRALT